MSGAARLARGLNRAFPLIVVAAGIFLFTQLGESRDALREVRTDLARLEALNAQLEERLVRLSSQQAQSQASPFGAMSEAAAARNVEQIAALSPAARKEALIEEQRTSDRARFEHLQQVAEQRQTMMAPPPAAASGTPGQLPPPLAEMMAKLRRAP